MSIEKITEYYYVIKCDNCGKTTKDDIPSGHDPTATFLLGFEEEDMRKKLSSYGWNTSHGWICPECKGKFGKDKHSDE